MQRVQTAYLARGVARPERLQATFGHFGKVKMRFRESRNRTWVGKRRTCRGANRFIKRRGVFRGNLRFKGEGGYVSIRIHRAKGAVVTQAPKCRRRRGGGGFEPPLRQLLPAEVGAAGDRPRRRRLNRLPRDRRQAEHALPRQQRRIPRQARDRPHRDRPQTEPVRINESLTSASLSPPSPFHGDGRYRAAPDGSTAWSGSLSVNFPGAPRFPLTGPSFETFLEVPF